jgi:hypothetical protein
VEEDGGRILAGCGLDHGVGEVAVDGDVALLPGPPRFVPERGRVREIVEPVLDEPQERVGELVVHQVVGVRVVLYEPDTQVLDLVWRRFLRDCDVLLALGRGDPDGVLGASEDRVQGGDEAPRSPGVLALARLAAGERYRPPVRDHDGPSAFAVRHGPPLVRGCYTPSSLAKRRRSSRRRRGVR